jgi:hypothetical protein
MFSKCDRKQIPAVPLLHPSLAYYFPSAQRQTVIAAEFCWLLNSERANRDRPLDLFTAASLPFRDFLGIH